MAYQLGNIKSIKGNVIEVYHPDLVEFISYLTSANAAGATSLTLNENIGFSQNDFFVIGKAGYGKTEIKKVNAAVTAGTALTTTTLTFDHPINTPIQKILWDRIEVSGASTLTGSKTVVLDATTSAGDIRIDENIMTYVVTGTTYSFYFVRYYNSQTTTYSAYSDGVADTGYARGEVGYLIKTTLEDTKRKLDDRIDHEWFFRNINDCLGEISGKLKHWSGLQSFDYVLGQSTRGVYSYSLPADIYDKNTNKSILGVYIGTDKNLIYQDKREWEELLKNVKHTQVRTQAVAADTTLAIDNSYDFDDSGSVNVYVSGTKYTLTYTGVTRSATAGVLTGIPASGTGSITVTIAVDVNVWDDEDEGKPSYYTIYDGSLYIWSLPDTTNDNMNVYLDYYTKATAVDSLTDTIEFPRYEAIQHYLKWKLRSLDNSSGQLDLNDADYQKYSEGVNTMIRKEISGQKWKQIPLVNKITY